MSERNRACAIIIAENDRFTDFKRFFARPSYGRFPDAVVRKVTIFTPFLSDPVSRATTSKYPSSPRVWTSRRGPGAIAESQISYSRQTAGFRLCSKRRQRPTQTVFLPTHRVTSYHQNSPSSIVCLARKLFDYENKSTTVVQGKRRKHRR